MDLSHNRVTVLIGLALLRMLVFDWLRAHVTHKQKG